MWFARFRILICEPLRIWRIFFHCVDFKVDNRHWDPTVLVLILWKTPKRGRKVNFLVWSCMNGFQTHPQRDEILLKEQDISLIFLLHEKENLWSLRKDFSQMWQFSALMIIWVRTWRSPLNLGFSCSFTTRSFDLEWMSFKPIHNGVKSFWHRD